jgi:hypothetical protein
MPEQVVYTRVTLTAWYISMWFALLNLAIALLELLRWFL